MAPGLQRELFAAFDAVGAARETLSDLEFVAFVAIVLERYTKESARLGFGEAIRAARGRS
jgi:hypothetical protein